MKPRPTIILGRVTLGEAQSGTLNIDERFVLTQQQFRLHIKAHARVGDLIWVQEPVLLITTGELQTHMRRGLFSLVAPFQQGAALDARVREMGYTRKYRFRKLGAELMRRPSSRCTLEIEAFDIEARTLTCIVHMEQADELLAKRRVA